MKIPFKTRNQVVVDTPKSSSPRRSRWRTVRRAVLGPLVLAALAGGVMASAGSDSAGPSGSGSTDLSGTQPVAYKEECIGEGCSNEEIRELYNSFYQECFIERCWTEEVFELAGGARYHDLPYHQDTRVQQMYEAFRFRLGKQFQDPDMKSGPTDDFWSFLIKKADGRVIKTPRTSCDPYCG